MAYRFRSNESFEHGLRRIATDQLRRAVERARAPEGDGHEAVHEVRKRCKKVRGMLRLVRHCFDDRSKENAAVRDAARDLADLRDATSGIETVDALRVRFEKSASRGVLEDVRARLVDRRLALARPDDVAARLRTAAAALEEVERRADSWSLDANGADAFSKGLARTFGDAKSAMKSAVKRPTDETLHEWRKRVKDHRYHARLLARAWPAVMDAWHDEADRLGGLLGDDHDLAVLCRLLDDEPERFAALDLEPLRSLADRRRSELQAAAFSLGRRLFAESPGRHAKRTAKAWTAWVDACGDDRLRDEERTGDCD